MLRINTHCIIQPQIGCIRSCATIEKDVCSLRDIASRSCGDTLDRGEKGPGFVLKSGREIGKFELLFVGV